MQLLYKLRVPNPERFVVMRQAFDDGYGVEELFKLTNIDRWWLVQLKEVFDQTNWLKTRKLTDLDAVDFRELKSRGFSDSQIARAIGERPPSNLIASTARWLDLDERKE